jgi:3-methyladenine DNA glycosylase AlkC
MEAFKNKLSMDLVHIIAQHLAKQLSLHNEAIIKDTPQLTRFDEATFCASIELHLADLELKQRAQCIADEIHKVLPTDLTLRYQIIRGMLHSRPHANQKISQQSDENGLCGWAMMTLGPIVAQHGLENFDLSLNLLKDMTAYFSSEFDIRPFIIADQAKALSIIMPWAQDEDYQVRRLASEGTRPRLPWAMQLPNLIKDPGPLMPLLSALKDDKEEYVRRSVANHLNDIAKDHPDLVANVAHDWLNLSEVDTLTQDNNLVFKDMLKNREKLVKHACRTLIKQGHPNTLQAFGIHPAKVLIESLAITNEMVNIGENLNFELTLKSQSKQKQALIIDYVIHHKKANGSLTQKVFKWKNLSLNSEQTLMFDKKHPFKVITTRKYYPGIHALSLRINGEDYEYREFELNLGESE